MRGQSIFRPRAKAAAAVAILAVAAVGISAQGKLGLESLKSPVTVVIRNSGRTAVNVGFSSFTGLDEARDCMDEVFRLEPGASRSFAGIRVSPCFYYASAVGAIEAWGGKFIWAFAGFPGNTIVFVKPFYLDQDLPKGGERTIDLSPENAWIGDYESWVSYNQFTGYDPDWFKWMLMASFQPCGPEDERVLEVVNSTSQPLRIFISSSINSGLSDERCSSSVIPRGGSLAIRPRSGVAKGRAEILRLSASQENGPLYWYGTSEVSGKPSDFGGVVAPKMAEMPILKGCKTRMVFSDDRAMGSGRYILMIVNKSSYTADVEIDYTPYPGDTGHESVRLAPQDEYAVRTPNPRVSCEAEAREGKNVYRWARRDLTLRDDAAYGSCDYWNLAD